MLINISKYESLETAKSQAKDKVDDLAGSTREKYITVVPGQDAVYATKGNEMKDYFKSGNPDPADYPHLQAEARARNMTIAEAAAYIQQVAAQWTALSATIEEYRVEGKVTIDAATTTRDVEIALETTSAKLLLV